MIMMGGGAKKLASVIAGSDSMRSENEDAYNSAAKPAGDGMDEAERSVGEDLLAAIKEGSVKKLVSAFKDALAILDKDDTDGAAPESEE